jgi:hypothetical protein
MEFPLPQIPGLAAKLIRTVPFETRATLLAMLWALVSCATPARAVRMTAILTSGVMESVFIC